MANSLPDSTPAWKRLNEYPSSQPGIQEANTPGEASEYSLASLKKFDLMEAKVLAMNRRTSPRWNFRCCCRCGVANSRFRDKGGHFVNCAARDEDGGGKCEELLFIYC